MPPIGTNEGTLRRRDGGHVLSAAMHGFAEATSDYPRLLERIVRTVAEAIGDSCIMLLLSDDKQSLRPVAAYDADPEITHRLLSIFDQPLTMAQPSLARDVMQSGLPTCIPALDLDDFRTRTSVASYEFHRRLGTQGIVVVPLRVRGEPLGAFSVIRHRSHHAPLDASDVELAHDLANHAALAISNARLLVRAQDELRRRERAEAASEALRFAQDDTARANRFLDAIIENIPDMVFVKDASKLAFTRFNRAGEELLGVSREALMGKSDYDFFPATEAEFFQAKDRETLAGGVLVDIPEEPIQTSRGQRWLHTKKVPIVDDDGAPIYLLGISHDITDRRNADAALRLAKDAAESANRELEAFSYSVAHDLRAPLRSIDGFSQALLEDCADKLDAEGLGYLRRVREGAQHMAQLIDGLLTLSRLTRAEMTHERVDLTALARASVERLGRLEPERRVSVVVEDGLSSTGDPRLLAVVLDNLLGNAWKFTSKRADARIEVGSARGEGGLGFFVRDNGAGFDMTYASRLFGVFQRLHGAGEFAGTGIGLATVQRVVGRHGGRVWAEGEVDAGATFHFTLASEEHPRE